MEHLVQCKCNHEERVQEVDLAARLISVMSNVSTRQTKRVPAADTVAIILQKLSKVLNR